MCQGPGAGEVWASRGFPRRLAWLESGAWGELGQWEWPVGVWSLPRELGSVFANVCECVSGPNPEGWGQKGWRSWAVAWWDSLGVSSTLTQSFWSSPLPWG